MKKLVLLFFVACINLNAQAQDSLKQYNTSHDIGFNTGFSTGVGFSYVYSYKNFGLQATLLPLYSSDFKWISTGANFLYYFNRKDEINLYFFNGHHALNRDKGFQYNIGVGPGAHVNILDMFVFNIGVGYGLYDITNKFHSGITVDIGLFYRFSYK